MINNTPVLLGRHLQTRHFVGENYIEVDFDILSSMVAQKVMGLCLKDESEGGLRLDIGVVLEARTENELPEQLLGAFSIENLSLNRARRFRKERRRTTIQVSPRKSSVLGLGFLSSPTDDELTALTEEAEGQDVYEYHCVVEHSDDEGDESEAKVTEAPVETKQGEETDEVRLRPSNLQTQTHAHDAQAEPGGACEAGQEAHNSALTVHALTRSGVSVTSPNTGTAALRTVPGEGAPVEQLQKEVQRLTLRLRAAHKHIVKAVWNKLRLWQCEMALERWVEVVAAQQRREHRVRASAGKAALPSAQRQPRLTVDTAFRERQHKGKGSANNSSQSHSGGRSGERSSGRRSDGDRSSKRSSGEGKRSSGNGAGNSHSHARSGARARARTNSRESSPGSAAATEPAAASVQESNSAKARKASWRVM